VVDLGDELHLGRHQRVLLWEGQDGLEEATLAVKVSFQQGKKKNGRKPITKDTPPPPTRVTHQMFSTEYHDREDRSDRKRDSVKTKTENQKQKKIEEQQRPNSYPTYLRAPHGRTPKSDPKTR
jgi:hypothetical protein